MTRILISTICVLSLALFNFNQQAKCDDGAKQQIADRAGYLAPVSALLNATWPKNRTVNIVCHGHSVPAGYFKTPVVDSLNAYPHLLHAGLKKQFPHAVMNVIVTAIGGESSDRGAARFEADVLTHRPDIVTIDYGLNDRRLGLEKSKESWTKMIQAAQARGIRVILLTPTGDLSAKLDQPSDPLNQHAEQIRQLARQHGVGLVDSLTLFEQHVKNGGKLDDLMSQINHPNRRGHELVADALLSWFPK